MIEWISVDDRLPDPGSWVIVYSNFNGGSFVDFVFFDGKNEHDIHWLKDGDYDLVVSHWMPEPDPPKG